MSQQSMMELDFHDERARSLCDSSGGYSEPPTPSIDGRDKLEPIAIVGLSLKFPQDATSPEAFWKMMLEKRCAMTEWPKDRLNLDAFYHPDGNRPDTIPVRGGHFLKEDLGLFDAPFFSITPNEASSMDPQHRRLLETAYHALENAGIPMEKIFGSRTSVYTGSFADDYKTMTNRDVEDLPKYAATGASMSILANRLSWFFNLTGPSVNLDSACSSSLLALDIACQGIRNGDADTALVCGSNTVFGLDTYLTLTNMNFLSADSRCYSFDSRANGYARGEGFGVVVLKRLSDAIRDGDTIRAVVRSTGSNQDGRTPGMTQPSMNAQERLIRETYEKAGLDPQMTRFFEAHGTGTLIGDPTEAGAIGLVFSEHRSREEPLYVGAVKSNIGHLEGASGIAGLIKTILVLEKGIIPPNTNFDRLNPKINAEILRLKFPTSWVAWPSTVLRRASINSFGFGGTNSHAVIDDAYNFLRLRNIKAKHSTIPQPPPLDTLDRFSGTPLITLSASDSVLEVTKQTVQNSRPKLLVWSATDEGGLPRLSTVYNEHFKALSVEPEEAEIYYENLAFTLAARRSSFPWKSFATTNSFYEMCNKGVSLSKPIRSSKKTGILFVFTGQGAQYKGMGRELLAWPVFKDTLLQAESCLHSFGCQWSLVDELLRVDNSKVDNPEYSQPLCIALQIALVDLLRSFGIYPAAVVGHSSGEIAAAYCVGSLSLASACKVAYFRGKLAAKLSGRRRGAMISVGLSEGDAETYLQNVALMCGNRGISIACINSPKNVTVSGDEDQIDMLKILLDETRIFARKLQVDVAYHSSHMEGIADEYISLIRDLEAGNLPFIPPEIASSVTGKKIKVDEFRKSEYWVRNMVSPVRFSPALAVLASKSVKDIRSKLRGPKDPGIVYDVLEIGPHSALQRPVKEILDTTARGKEIIYYSLLSRQASAAQTMLNTIGHFHCLGYIIDLPKVNHESAKGNNSLLSLTDLPEYPFDHSQTYWRESRLSKNLRLRKHPRLDLLGAAALDWNPLEAKWRRFIRIAEIPWVEDHKVNGSIIYPAAGMLVMAIEAMRQMADEGRKIKGYLIKDATFVKPLNIRADQESVETHLYMRPLKNSFGIASTTCEFRLCTFEDDVWAENSRGVIQAEYEEEQIEVDKGKEDRERMLYYKGLYAQALETCTRNVDGKVMYEFLEIQIGLDYGPSFQALHNLTCNDKGEAMAEIKTFKLAGAEKDFTQSHVIHPTTLDAMAQLILVALTRGGKRTTFTTIPTRIYNSWISNSGLSYPLTDSFQTYTKSSFKGRRATESAIFAVNKETGDVLATINVETTTIATGGKSSIEKPAKRQICYHTVSKPDLNSMDQETMARYCKDLSIPQNSQAGLRSDLELILATFANRAIQNISEDSINESNTGLQRYKRWLSRHVEKYIGEECREMYPKSERKALPDDNEQLDALCDQIEAILPGAKYLIEIGRQLPAILTGESSLLSLSSQIEIEKDYLGAISLGSTCFPPLAKYLDALAHKNPNLKVLEISGGVNSSTTGILEILGVGDKKTPRNPRCSQYDFTATSSEFLDSARQLFHNYESHMNFKHLDISEDSKPHDFEDGSYDLIIAGNSLQGGSDLGAAVRMVRSLLKPGGTFALYEVTEDTITASFALGLSPSSWYSSENGQRDGLYLAVANWRNLLSQNNFSGIDLIFAGENGSLSRDRSLMISTATLETPNTLTVPRTLIVTLPDSELQQSVAQELQITLTSKGATNSEVIPFAQLPLAQAVAKSFIVFLVELEKPLLSILNDEEFITLRDSFTLAQGAVWVTGNKLEPEMSMIDGLARAVRTENVGIKFVTLALESSYNSCAKGIARVFESTISAGVNDYEPEYTEEKGILHIKRLIESNMNDDIQPKAETHQSKVQEFGAGPPLSLVIESFGLLDSMRFHEDEEHSKPLGPLEVEIEVKAVGLDDLTASGRIDQDSLGSECAGIITRTGSADTPLKPGDRVCAAVLGSFKTYTRVDALLVAKIPDELSFTDATTLPITFLTSYHALVGRARLEARESILIHSALGAIGQSAVQIAQHIGAEVYVTVGSDEEKKLIIDAYNIPDDHIFYSRNTSFAKAMMRMTHGRGVDVILNSLPGEGLVASWECMAPFGRFLELGKRDIQANTQLPMSSFTRNVSYFAIDVADLSRLKPFVFQKSLQRVVGLIMEKALHTPRPLHIYSVSKVLDAFQFTQSNKSSGKTVVEINRTDLVPVTFEIKPSYNFEANAAYVIAGGLGGLGRSTARWMASRGAKNLVLLSRSGPKTEAAVALINELKALGVRVEAPPCDVTNSTSLQTVLNSCAALMPPIKGCIQGTMVLRDTIFEKMSFENWTTSIRPKVQGSWNLHNLLPKDLDFFILLSSISGIIGNGGQANYAAGNTYMDALAHHRIAHGQKATSLDLGWMESEGVVAESEALQRGMQAAGFLAPVSQGEFFALLEHYCNPALEIPTATPENAQLVIGLETPAAMLAKGVPLDTSSSAANFLRTPPFSHLHQIPLPGHLSITSSSSVKTSSTSSESLATLLSKPGHTLSTASTIILTHLLPKLARSLGISEADIEPSKPLYAYGVDSLLAVELRNWCRVECGADVAVFDLMGSGSIQEVCGVLAGKSALWKG